MATSNSTMVFALCILCCWITLSDAWLYRTRNSPKVCYDRLGCFGTEAPFTNTHSILPQTPAQVGTRFLLFTHGYKSYQELVMTERSRACEWGTLCEDKPIRLIIHGYMDHVEKPWMADLITQLLKHEDSNVIGVDWHIGARDLNYYQSVSNTRVVGAEVAHFLTGLRDVYNISLANVHIIGHSLGAHVAGHAGEYIEGIGRITGLDPAGPAFYNVDARVRLDPTDAIFVDVIHTDTESFFRFSGFGLQRAMGTVDFYPNGGKDQPGCPDNRFEQVMELLSSNFDVASSVGCNHMRALHFFTESINSNCRFESVPCSQINAMSSIMCNRCDPGFCGSMGFHTSPDTKPGMYYLQTNPQAPFCMAAKSAKASRGSATRTRRRRP